MTGTAARPRVRPLAMRLHRWVALVLGLWFAMLGVTGSVLVWHAEADRALNPEWFAPQRRCDARTETPVATSMALFARAAPGGTASQVMAPIVPGAAFVVWQKPVGDGPRRQHFVDADCGRYLGWRDWGAARIDRAHVVPAIYELHRSLLSKEAGHVAVGFAGLLLLFVAITGGTAAWPRHATREAWTRTLTIKRGAGRHRRYYDLHRATGLWTLLFLLLMGVTGTYLCFPGQTRALVASVLPTRPAAMREAPPAQSPASSPADPDALVRRAQSLWPDAQWTRVQIPADAAAAHDVRLLQRGELRADTGDTRVRLDAAGRVADVRDPLHAPAGDRLLGWLFPLHSGEALGLAGRLAWTVFGLAPVLLFVTGAWLWWKRRRAAHAHAGALRGQPARAGNAPREAERKKD
jgi:uncharacterized iron-regulated membrane protein